MKYKEESQVITTVNEIFDISYKPLILINIMQITMKLEATGEDL